MYAWSRVDDEYRQRFMQYAEGFLADDGPWATDPTAAAQKVNIFLIMLNRILNYAGQDHEAGTRTKVDNIVQ